MPFAVLLPDPNETDGIESRPSRWLRFWSITSVALSAVIYVGIYISGLQFEDLFRGFGGDLPWLTRVVLVIYKLSGLLLLVGLIPCAILLKGQSMSPKKVTRLVEFVAIGFGLACTSLTIFIIATYLPVFAMGATVL